MKTWLPIFFFLGLLSCQQPSTFSSFNYCGNNDKIPLSEIKKLKPFDKIKRLNLISFKSDSIDGSIADHLILNDDIMQSSLIENKELSLTETNELLEILINYNYNKTLNDTIRQTEVICYNPRNAILMIDDHDKIIGCIELCFECFGSRVKPSTLRIGKFCDEKFRVIKNIFKTAGIKYGVADINQDEEDIKYINEEIKAIPNNPILLRVRASIEIRMKNFDGALSDLNRSIELDSSHSKTFLMRGQCKSKLADFKGAISDFDRTIKLNPNLIGAYSGRAMAKISLMAQGKTTEPDLIKNVCEDLKIARAKGDDSLDVINMTDKYCK